MEVIKHKAPEKSRSKADFIVLDFNKPHLTPIYNLPSRLV